MHGTGCTARSVAHQRHDLQSSAEEDKGKAQKESVHLLSSPNRPEGSSQMLVMEISLSQEAVWSSQHCVPDVRSAGRREFVHTEVLPVAALILPELPWLGPAEREVRI